MTSFDRSEEVQDKRVKNAWFLQVYRVPAAWEHRQATIGDLSLHEEGGFEAGLIFITHEKQCGH